VAVAAVAVVRPRSLLRVRLIRRSRAGLALRRQQRPLVALAERAARVAVQVVQVVQVAAVVDAAARVVAQPRVSRASIAPTMAARRGGG
jgi:hypothetical protein